MKMSPSLAKGAYYNENDPYKAEWLRQLIRDGEIAAGEVDERSVWDVSPNDVANFRQAHFFAGVGGWSRALRLAGWPDDRPCWTGSAPCQPFSQAGERKGFADQRHLWPAWFWLIRQCRPDTVFGEQVSSNDGLAWLDVVSSDLENEGYEIGAFDLCAAGAGAPHNRARLYFVANADGAGQSWGSAGQSGERPLLQTSGHVSSGPLADASSKGLSLRQPEQLSGAQRDDERGAAEQSSGTFWANAHWVTCTDGKTRSVEPGAYPLAYGLPRSVGAGSTREQRMELVAAKAYRKTP